MPRSNNEPVTGALLIAALEAVMVPNTLFQAAGGTALVNSRKQLYTNDAVWPALVMFEGPQSTARIAWRTWQSKITVLGQYYARWDQNNIPLDTLWETIDGDLRLMKANLTDNPRVFVSGTRWALDIVMVALSPYEAMVNERMFSFPVVERNITIQVNLTPYVSAS